MVKGFKYHTSNYTYYRYFKNSTWHQGYLSEDIHITISSLSSAIQYGQQVFEGLKAYKTKNGEVRLFRPDANAKRFRASCERLMMPTLSDDDFISACVEIVKANIDLVPAYETKGSLYLRPFMIGVGHNLGVKPSEDYLFGIAVSPVGNYYEHGFNPISVVVTDYDRAAPNGLGAFKAGGNYAGGLYPKHLAKMQGFDECLYLDAKTHTYLDEASATNVIFIKDGRYITPQSPSILPSITNENLQIIAKDKLNLEVICRSIDVKELESGTELGFCGTAAVITPVSKVVHGDMTYTFDTHKILTKLYQCLVDIQTGENDAYPEWIVKIS